MSDELRGAAALSTFHTLEVNCGGGGGSAAGGGIYGTLTEQSICNIIDCMLEQCPLNKDSLFLDIGSGLSKVNLVAAYRYGFPVSVGLENDPAKCFVACRIVSAVAAEQARNFENERRAPDLLFGDVMRMCTPCVFGTVCLHQATHVYTFWQGMPSEVQDEILRKVHCCSSIYVFAAVGSQSTLQRADKQLASAFKLLEPFSVKQSGGGGSHRVGIFVRIAEFQPPEEKCQSWELCDSGVMVSKSVSNIASGGKPWHNRDPGRIKFVHMLSSDNEDYERLYAEWQEGKPRRSGRNAKPSPCPCCL